MKKVYQFLLPVVVLFILVNVFAFAAPALLTQWRIDSTILLIANLLFFVTTCINFSIQLKALNNKNPNVFIRSIMGTMMIKMAVVVIALMVYWKLSGDTFSKTTVFVCIGLYFIYFVTGVYSIMRLNKSKHA